MCGNEGVNGSGVGGKVCGVNPQAEASVAGGGEVLLQTVALHKLLALQSLVLPLHCCIVEGKPRLSLTFAITNLATAPKLFDGALSYHGNRHVHRADTFQPLTHRQD